MIALVVKALKSLLSVLMTVLPIPLGLILAAGLWIHFDKNSAIRTAVDQAIFKLVAGAQIDAANSKIEAEKTLRLFVQGQLTEQRRQTAEIQKSNQSFAERLSKAELDRESLSQELDDVLTKPTPAGCSVDDRLIERLRSK
jgi:DNA-dependent RNA polymerase auxiliary subunit epsilon